MEDPPVHHKRAIGKLGVANSTDGSFEDKEVFHHPLPRLTEFSIKLLLVTIQFVTHFLQVFLPPHILPRQLSFYTGIQTKKDPENFKMQKNPLKILSTLEMFQG